MSELWRHRAIRPMLGSGLFKVEILKYWILFQPWNFDDLKILKSLNLESWNLESWTFKVTCFGLRFQDSRFQYFKISHSSRFQDFHFGRDSTFKISRFQHCNLHFWNHFCIYVFHYFKIQDLKIQDFKISRFFQDSRKKSTLKSAQFEFFKNLESWTL